MSDAMKPLISAASEGPLSSTQAEAAFALLFDGEATMAQIGGLLMAMRARGESVTEYAAAATAMRARCNPVQAPANAIDIVGTGGDGMKTLNISTATAFVVAGTGLPVAKHGNKNLSSLSGAGDILTEMGIKIMVGPDVVEAGLKEANIGFMMAPMHHPAVKHVMPARQELGCKTIFNILGPITNPAGVKRQLSGAFDPNLILPMAETLRELGSEAAWLVHGSDGTDEITICGPTAVAALTPGGNITSLEVHPEDAGLPVHPFKDILGGTPADNAAAFRALLDGAENAYRDAVLLNAAAACVVAETVKDLKEGVEIARESIDSGKAKAAVETLARVTSAA